MPSVLVSRFFWRTNGAMGLTAPLLDQEIRFARQKFVVSLFCRMPVFFALNLRGQIA